MENIEVINLHVKFQEHLASARGWLMVVCLNAFENKGHGYKFFGKESTFPTPRFTVSYAHAKDANDSFQELSDLFKDCLDKVTLVLYTKEHDIFNILKMEGKRDENLLTELMNTDAQGVPLNT